MCKGSTIDTYKWQGQDKSLYLSAWPVFTWFMEIYLLFTVIKENKGSHLKCLYHWNLNKCNSCSYFNMWEWYNYPFWLVENGSVYSMKQYLQITPFEITAFTHKYSYWLIMSMYIAWWGMVRCSIENHLLSRHGVSPNLCVCVCFIMLYLFCVIYLDTCLKVILVWKYEIRRHTIYVPIYKITHS